VVRYSFDVGLFHSFLHAGLSRRTVRAHGAFPLRFPLAFDGKLLGQVLRIFTDTVAGWYRKRLVAGGLPAGETVATTVIQRANSDLRLSPHFHTLFLDGVYGPDSSSSVPASASSASSSATALSLW
jgi:hypothetical protein